MSHLIYHYTHAAPEKILREGIFAPVRLANSPKEFAEMQKMYEGRIGKTKNPSEFLAKLDEFRGYFLGKNHPGRNIVYASFAQVPENFSVAHDNLISGSCFSIDLLELSKDKDSGLIIGVIEIPTEDVNNPLEIRSNFDGVKDWIGIDFVSTNWTPETSEGFTFGNIPHLALWTKTGVISPKFIKQIS